MDEFGIYEIDTELMEPASNVIQTKKGFIRKFLIRTDHSVQIVTVFAKDLASLEKDTIKIRFPSDFVFAVED